ncbi:MAG: hypothetical protein V4655_09425 [Bdellovibrionota bacterium]
MKKFLALFLISANSLAYAQNAPAPSPPAASSGGSERAIGEAYSIMASDRFLNPGAAKLNTIIGISKLNGVAHPIDFTKVIPKAHPALAYLSFDPMKILSKAETEYRKGDASRAAYTARRVMHVCSECHVFTAKPVWANIVPTGGLTMVEWGEFYKFASRPGDALLQYEKVINSPGLANTQPAIFERSALNIVALGIESSSNAYTFVDLISSALQTTTMTKGQKALLSSWRLTGKAWGAERDAVIKPYDILLQARQLMTTADGMNRSLPLSGFVHQARAMLALKRVATIGSPDQKARAFYMSGELREAISLEGVYLNAEDYYEACIRVLPKGPDAMKCLAALQSLSGRSKYMTDTDALRSLGAR